MTRSQAVLKSPRSGRSRCASARATVAQRLAEHPLLLAVLRGVGRRVGEGGAVAAAQQVDPATRSAPAGARIANIGASTDLTRVSPVLPSCPAYGTAVPLGGLRQRGQARPGDGVKSTNGAAGAEGRARRTASSTAAALRPRRSGRSTAARSATVAGSATAARCWRRRSPRPAPGRARRGTAQVTLEPGDGVGLRLVAVRWRPTRMRASTSASRLRSGSSAAGQHAPGREHLGPLAERGWCRCRGRRRPGPPGGQAGHGDLRAARTPARSCR